MKEQEFHTKFVSTDETKKAWTAPSVYTIDQHIIQQEQVELEQLLQIMGDDGFKMLSGSVSDHRLKTDPVDFNAIDIVEQLKAYEFAWKHNQDKEVGFLAHEIQAVLPYLVVGEKDGVDADGNPVFQRVNYAKLTPVLLKAIQEQQAIIEKMQKQLEHLSIAVGVPAE